ncbi:MAG TPA: 50S ribosomal protein L24 [Candidatus Pacearchaeota archaeon]|nr:50S ribosomal protein L24 [Candidatus Pacearchaeota archaeon]
MNQKFNTSWKASKRPGKQRKYLAKAPLHIKQKLVAAHLSKELREKYKRRRVSLRKGDTVKIMAGKFKDKTGKVTKVLLKTSKILVEGIQVKKQDGSKSDVKLVPCKMQIIQLNLDDKKRFKERKQTSSVRSTTNKK